MIRSGDIGQHERKGYPGEHGNRERNRTTGALRRSRGHWGRVLCDALYTPAHRWDHHKEDNQMKQIVFAWTTAP